MWSSNRTPSSISITFLNLNFVYVYVIGAAPGVQLRKENHDSINTFPDGCIRSNNFFIFLGQQVLKKIKEEGYINCTLVQVRWASKGGLKGSKKMGITGSQPGLLLPISANPLTASRISASPFHSSFCLGLFDTRVKLPRVKLPRVN